MPKVNYSPRLVSLIQEVRQLKVMGLNIPPAVDEIDTKARLYFRQAKDLQQIGNFYTTIADHMILSQRPMMLSSAQQFTKLMNSKEKIATWNDPQAVDAYIKKLRDIAEKLSRLNRMLRRQHLENAEKVLILMNTDLLNEQQVWKDQLSEIRGIMNQLQARGFSPDHMKSWKTHWDRQLYKALDYQYAASLSKLSQHMAEIRVDLTFRNGEIAFRPPLEEVRAKYFSQIKKFLSIPHHFKGVSNTSEGAQIFASIIDKHADKISALYRDQHAVLEQVERSRDRFEGWVSFGGIDLEDIVEECCKTPDDWRLNLKMVKIKSQEFAKMNIEEEKFDCITVSFAPIKSYIDYLLSEINTTLVQVLQSSITKDANRIQNFIQQSTSVLLRRPQTVDEMTESVIKLSEIRQTRSELQNVYEQSEAKNQILGRWSRKSVKELNQLSAQWDTLDRLIEDFEANVREQAEVLKANLLTKMDNFDSDVTRLCLRWKNSRPKKKDDFEQASQLLKEFRLELNALLKTKGELIEESKHFGVDSPSVGELEALSAEFEDEEKVWLMFEEFDSDIKKLADEEWVVIRGRLHRFENLLGDWSRRLKDIQESAVTVPLFARVDSYRELLSVLKFCKGEEFSPHHWGEFFAITGIPQKSADKLLFADFLSAKNVLLETSAQLKDLNNRAHGEVTIREAFNELEFWSNSSKFSLVSHEDSNGEALALIRDWSEVTSKVGDNQCLLQAMKDSSFYPNFADRAQVWEHRLSNLDSALYVMQQVQRRWTYLDPILGQGALPSEASRFNAVSNEFKNLMRGIQRDPRVVLLSNQMGLVDSLTNMLDQLNRSQKALNQYLEVKRSLFPRFYFLGDEDLLEILGQATRPQIIQSHLKKLFAGIHRVQFNDTEDSSKLEIEAMVSQDGEVVPLEKPVKVVREVEVWLLQLSREMQNTLRNMAHRCFGRDAAEAALDEFPSQVLCLSEMLVFTQNCEKAIESKSLDKLRLKLTNKLSSYTSRLGTLTDPLQSLKLKALVLDVIHNMDVVEYLIEHQVVQLSDWCWQKQLRAYMQKDNTIRVNMVDASFEYTYEYQGNAAKLVHTPLTDKCFLTLTQGMKMGMGGNPYGPAGTGKTESVKALGSVLARQVLVFNCDEGIDVKSMNRIFIGLVKCGAWGCFDEFNRLEEGVLSALSVHIQAIQHALKDKRPSTILSGQTVDVNPNAGIFVTMNPAGKGYGGRQKLPDNLKQLFRPVAMTVPDNVVITQVLLYAEGFKFSNVLSTKLVAVFTLAKEFLSEQQHYDWGLRSLKSVIQACGAQLRQADMVKDAREHEESKVIIRALRLNTLSKLSYRDSRQFDALIQDIFPDVELENFENESLAAACREACRDLKLEIDEKQIKKMIELDEQLRQRMGVVIVGPSGSGKSTLWKVLKTALLKQAKDIKVHVFNPKAMSRTQLLGSIDLDTREWHDGVLTLSARQVIKEEVTSTSWIICDGDVDPEWIEALNSVLDDNRLLTMPSGERIQFGSNVNFLFETHDLSHASPATISRMGIIHLSVETMSPANLLWAWLKGEKPDVQVILKPLLENYFLGCLDWVLKRNENAIPTTSIGSALGALSLLHGVKSKAELAAALVHGFGANLRPSARQPFAQQTLNSMGEMVPDPNRAEFTYFNKRRDRLDVYQKAEDRAVDITSLTGPIGRLPVIETIPIQRASEILIQWLAQTKPIIIAGPQGSGKCLLVRHSFAKMSHMSIQLANFYCSSQTRPVHVHQKLLQHCIVVNSGSTSKILRPKDSEKLVVLLKDISVPKKDKWGTCQLIEWLQQITNYGGFYDENLDWVVLERIQFVATVSDGTSISTRFTSISLMMALEHPGPDELLQIYSALLRPVVAESSLDVNALTSAMVKLLMSMRKSFSMSSRKHYVFTAKNLTEWTRTLTRYTKSESELATVWCHEGLRIFGDSLATESDVRDFLTLFAGILDSDLGGGFKKILLDLVSREFFFVASDGSPNALGKDLVNMQSADWAATLQKISVRYASQVRQIRPAFHEDLLDLSSKIDRLLSQNNSSILLVGQPGLGRRMAVSLLAHLYDYTFVSPKIKLQYSVSNFNNEIKVALQSAGFERKPTVLLIEEHQIEKEEFLEIICGIIASGELPGLFAPQELEPLKEVASDEGFRGGVFAYFAEKVKQNLRVVITMSYSDPRFNRRLEDNPALFKHCTVVWTTGWSSETMENMPTLMIESNDRPKTANSDRCSVEAFAKLFSKVHESVGVEYSSPRTYQGFIKAYDVLYQNKYSELKQRKLHLKAGVEKLDEAKATVDELRANAKVQGELLVKKRAEADEALKAITDSVSRTTEQRSEMQTLQKRMVQENKKQEQRKKEIDAELSEIEPLINQAKDAVGGIKAESLSEIRSLRAPPDVIRDILEGVLSLMGATDLSWVSMKTFLSKRGVKEEILNFDAHNISDEMRQNVEALLQKRGASFDPKNAKRASAAAAPLADWVRANVKYAAVLQKIEPLEKEHKRLIENLNTSEQRSKDLASALEGVDRRVAELKDQLNKLTTEAAQIEIGLKAAQDTLNAAEGLVGQLQDEYARWRQQLADIDSQLQDLPLRCLMAAASVTYLGQLPEDVRQKLVTTWTGILNLSSDFDTSKFLSSEQEVLIWRQYDLPSDKLSVDNAIFIKSSPIATFVIDPTSCSMNWLKSYRSKTVEIVSQHEDRFLSALELAIRFGKLLVVPDTQKVEPILIPLLRKDLINQGSRSMVQLGDKLIDLHDDFELVLHTQNSLISLPPYVDALVNVVNFSITKAALSEQLLDRIIHNENPDVEEKRMELIKNQERMKVDLARMEDELLNQLASSQGNLLENKVLLASLNHNKTNSITIANALEESEKLQASAEAERRQYSKLADFASDTFFVTRDLRQLSPMYLFHLSTFVEVFENVLKTTTRSPKIEDVIAELSAELLRATFLNFSRALFKEDRICFALYLLKKMQAENFPAAQWESFIGLGESKAEVPQSSVPPWVEADQYLALAAFKAVNMDIWPALELHNESWWKEFGKSDKCENEFPPQAKLKPFNEVLLIKALRPDRLYFKISDFAATSIGVKDLSAGIRSLKRVFVELSSARVPILISVPSGIDPSIEIAEAAETTVGSGKYRMISLGHEQTAEALKALKELAVSGHWLCLTNLHLVTTWIPNLLKELATLEPHADFRLWLTTEPRDTIPPRLIEISLKIAYETPPGLKRNMQRIYDSWSQDTISCRGNLQASQCVFVLAWFHAIIQERRTYIPQGWSKGYEFSAGDLKAALQVVQQQFTSGSVEWSYLQGLLDVAIYGGRIESAFDDRILRAYVTRLFNKQVVTGSSRSQGVAPNVGVPGEATGRDHLKIIQALPEEDKAAFFNLPANIKRTQQKVKANEIISRLKQMSIAKSDEKSDKTAERWNRGVGPLLALWKKLNEGLSIHQQKIDEFGSESESPLETFVSNEWSSAVRLVQTIHHNLSEISKIIRGTALVTSASSSIAEQLLRLETPSEWLRLWSGSEDPYVYLRLVVSKASSIQNKWLHRSGSLAGSSLDLAELFNPNKFLNALRQQTARQAKTAINALRLEVSFRKPLSSCPIQVKVENLLIEGALFDGSSLSECHHNSPTTTAVPVASLGWTSDMRLADATNVVGVPLYEDATRSKLVTSVDLPCDADPDTWILFNVALLLRNV
ncbi:cytoplasmic dynein 2 heavy chain 1 [Galendromus occidentalis]|uniref:Cytoplasmic dynein 2 heavy chain 1 n=1 Tax=Galendromus occidentalis TaxID=34638 RepID=A0AAJ7SH64_9ACAR|nr:cytoplasmic dynein 2 heavy chain 1 [Galendromus occidentalis]